MNITDQLHDEAYFVLHTQQEDPTEANGQDPTCLSIYDGDLMIIVAWASGGSEMEASRFQFVAFAAAFAANRPIYDIVNRVWMPPGQTTVNPQPLGAQALKVIVHNLTN